METSNSLELLVSIWMWIRTFRISMLIFINVQKLKSLSSTSSNFFGYCFPCFFYFSFQILSASLQLPGSINLPYFLAQECKNFCEILGVDKFYVLNFSYSRILFLQPTPLQQHFLEMLHFRSVGEASEVRNSLLWLEKL